MELNRQAQSRLGTEQALHLICLVKYAQVADHTVQAPAMFVSVVVLPVFPAQAPQIVNEGEPIVRDISCLTCKQPRF